MTSNSDIHLCELPYTMCFLFPGAIADPYTDTTGTPNGIKVSILLEELGLTYQVRSDGGCWRQWPNISGGADILHCQVTAIDLSKNTQKVC